MATGLESTNPWLQQPQAAAIALFRAIEARKYAHTWRKENPIHVGACGISLPDRDHFTAYIHGANFKPEQYGPINTHAEEEVLYAARSVLNVLAVVGDVQPDDNTGLAAETLLPCSAVCLPMLKASQSLESHSLILSANPDLSVVQYYGVPELNKVYETGDVGELITVHLETSLAADDAEWNEKIFLPLIDRIVERLSGVGDLLPEQ